MTLQDAEARLSVQQRFRIARARSQRLLEKYSPEQPRDDSGKWTSGGAGEGAGTADKPKGKPATKDDFDKAKIKLNVTSSEQAAFIDKWNDKVGVDPATFKHDFMGGLDGPMTLSASGDRVDINGDVEQGGRSVGTFTRNIYLDQKRAYSAYFKLNRDATGSDIGKKMLAGNVDTYQKLGLESVSVGANIDVGGYAWAKYGYVPTPGSWNDLRRTLEQKLGYGSSSSSAPASRNNTMEADEWGQLSSDVQDDVRDRWMRDSYDEFYQSEVDNWRDNGQAKDDAKYALANDYSHAALPDWAKDAFDNVHEAREESGDPPIPYSNQQLHEAIALEYQSNRGDGEDDPDISFDDDKLKEPEGHDPAQQTLPGIEPTDPSQRLTQQMRDQLEKELTKQFDKQADENAGDMDPPSHLADSISEYQSEWWDSADDSTKLRKAIEFGMADIAFEPDEEDAQPEEPAQLDLPQPTPAQDALLTALHSTDPKSIWKIADDPRGKRLLLGTSWSGVLNLKDPEQMARFNAYVGKAAHA